MAIYKKEDGYWPKLQKGGKLNFLKVDFQKWRDEDEEEEEGQQPADPMGGLDFQSLMAQAGAAGGGLPNMDNLVNLFLFFSYIRIFLWILIYSLFTCNSLKVMTKATMMRKKLKRRSFKFLVKRA